MYKPYTKPFDHQQETWEQSRDLKSFAAFWEQGTGKSKLTIDTLGHLFTQQEVNGAIIVAPNGVHRNWITDELPTHMSPDLPLNSFAYKSEASTTKWHAKEVAAILDTPSDELALLAISYDAWMTDTGKKAVWNMMRKRKTMCVLDESHRVKTPVAKRTRSILAGGKHAPYRRILSGTPVTLGPFDLYSQIKFLDADFWRRELDIDSYTAFKSFYGVWDKGWNPMIKNKDGTMGGEYDILVGYQNLEELSQTIKKISSRVRKEDVLDLPPKLYSKRYYEMSPAQRRIYDTLDKEFMAFLDSGELITAPLAMVRMLRLQQVLCGYIPTDDGDEPTELIERDANPRLKLLRDTMEDVTGKSIIWATWTLDINFIMEMLRGIGRNPVRYDGTMSGDERERAKNAFKKGDATDFVANSQMSEGLTLNEAKTTVYYNNSYKLVDRKQTEDRNHRIGQDESVLYLDLVCAGTRDEHAINSLIVKHDIASVILGDPMKEWL